MDRLKMHSPNFTDENIANLAMLFPNCVTESEDKNGSLKKFIDFDLLKQELSAHIVEGPQERYRLDWPGKRQALLTANAPIAKTLRPCREESVDFDTTENLFIEGDNLDALKLLQETYLGKVKMIYIDPPYNTGKDFIYADDFAESTEDYLMESGQKDEEGNRLVANTDSNGRFHSDWLSMMYSRLKLARNLLKDDGVIFISLDDNEIVNLRRICDEVFGEKNFLSIIIVQSNKRGQTYKEIAKCHEYILGYYKSDSASLGELDKEGKALPYSDKNGPYDLWELRNRNPKFGKHNRPNLFYPIYIDPNSKNAEGLFSISLTRTEIFSVEVLPKNSIGDDSCWRWGKNKVIREGINVHPQVLFGKSKQNGGWNIYEKSRKSTTKAKSIWADTKVISEQGTVEAGRLDMGGLLEFPKPIELVKRCIQLATGEGDIILDFFAGSATTAHAVMQLNAEDGGNRKFIMVQLPETCDEKSEAFKAGYKTIAEISKERIRRAGKKIKAAMEGRGTARRTPTESTCCAPTGSPQHAPTEPPNDASTESAHPTPSKNLDTGFRVLKVDTSNMADVYYSPDKVKQGALFKDIDNIKDDRTTEDLLFQVLLDWGVDLTLPITKETIADREVFFVDGNALAACFVKKGELTVDFCRELAKHHPLRVVFRDAGFKDDSVKINVEQIFKLMSPHTEVKTI